MKLIQGLKDPVFLRDLLERVLQVFVSTFAVSFLAGWVGDWSWTAVRALVLASLAAAGQAVLAGILKEFGPDKQTASVLPFRPDTDTTAPSGPMGLDPTLAADSPHRPVKDVDGL